MADDNETFEDVLREAHAINPNNEWVDRLRVAHKREMDHRALIAGVSLADAVDDAHKRELAAKDDERLTIVATYENVIAAKDAEIKKLEGRLRALDTAIPRVVSSGDHTRILAIVNRILNPKRKRG